MLRLPTEIRQCIWEYVLGGRIFLAKETQIGCRFTPHGTNLSTGVALLRVCRQIYSETAPLPYRFSIFTCDSSMRLSWAANLLKTYQRKQVAQLCLVCKNSHSWSWINDVSADLRGLFPNLEHIEVRVYELSTSQHDTLVRKVRSRLRETIRETGCNLSVVETVGRMDCRFTGPG